MPSSLWVGGRRMSRMTMSGRLDPDRLSRSSALSYAAVTCSPAPVRMRVSPSRSRTLSSAIMTVSSV